jgi:DNA-binding transcriptional regulator YiaG
VLVPRRPKSRIAFLRQEKRLTQTELAVLWQVSMNTVRAWETEPQKAWQLVKLILLCMGLSCAPQDLVQPLVAVSASSPTLQDIRQRLRQPSTIANQKLHPPTRIAELRQSLGLTQAQLAAALDVSEHTVQNWENERTSSRQFTQFIELCRILECDPEALVDYLPEAGILAVKELHSVVIKEQMEVVE